MFELWNYNRHKLTFQTDEKKKITLETVKLKFPTVPKQFIDYLTNEKTNNSKKIILPLTYKSIDFENNSLPVCTSILEHYSSKPQQVQDYPSTSHCSQNPLEESPIMDNIPSVSSSLTINTTSLVPEERKNQSKKSEVLLFLPR